MRVSNPFLIKYISERPEIDSWTIQRVNGKVALGFFNFKGDFITDATGISESDIADRIASDFRQSIRD